MKSSTSIDVWEQIARKLKFTSSFSGITLAVLLTQMDQLLSTGSLLIKCLLSVAVMSFFVALANEMAALAKVNQILTKVKMNNLPDRGSEDIFSKLELRPLSEHEAEFLGYYRFRGGIGAFLLTAGLLATAVMLLVLIWIPHHA